MKPTLTILTLAMLLPLAGREPLAARIAHADPAKYRHSPSVHGGPGALNYMALMDAHSLETNLQFIHRGVIEPKSGIGAHFTIAPQITGLCASSVSGEYGQRCSSAAF